MANDEVKDGARGWVEGLCPNGEWKEYLLGLIEADGAAKQSKK